MFPDEENSKPNTCINIFRRYTSALQGWLEGGHRDRQMYCEAIDLYMEFDLETFKLCMGLVQEKWFKTHDHVKEILFGDSDVGDIVMFVTL